MQNLIKTITPALKNGGWIAIAAAALFGATCAVMLHSPHDFLNLHMVQELSWLFFAAVVLAVAAAMLFLGVVQQHQRGMAMVVGAVVAFFSVLAASNAPSNIFLALGLCLPVFITLLWTLNPERNPFLRPHNMPMWTTHLVAVLLFVVFTAIMAYYSILRLRVFNATTFDLGIFAQMFEFARTTGRMLTTVERNQLLSHFAVHVSPIYYLVLPFYMLVPRIETLLVIQAAAVGAGVFAIRGIAQHLFGKSPRLIILSCLLFIFNPAFSSGLLFDFHENKFLTVLVLWAIYFMLKQKALPMLLFTLLVLMVKEDAAIYAGVLGLWLLLGHKWATEKERKRVISAIGIIGASVAWFLIARAIIESLGGTMMVSRLDNYFLPGSNYPGFVDVMMVILSNMGYVISQVFTAEKFPFMLWLLLPLGFAPILRKKGADWVLLIPLLVINFLSNYGYQFRIGFQYHYATFAMAMVLGLLALRGMKRVTRQRVLTFAVIASMITTLPLLLPRFQHLERTMQINEHRIAAVNDVLRNLPDGSVTATTFLAVHLYRREHLYMFPHWHLEAGEEQAVTEWLLAQPREVENNQHGIRYFIEEHYDFVQEVAFVMVFRARLAAEQSLRGNPHDDE
ncbi:MAG: DUF2079 domain-containing protein [Oscillospiraceae bacterium]|nr:DUF2079 domain-containing protein [Oscillospiraceae bacterium]